MNSCTTFLILAVLLSGCGPEPGDLSYRIVQTHPHDVDCYTQGLEFDGDRLLESGGQYGESKLRRVDPQSGEVLKNRSIPSMMFAEGLTLLDGDLWLLTWKERVALVFDPESFELKRRHPYEGEGWGLTNDGKRLIMSDGSSKLSIRDPESFKIVGTVDVTLNGRPVEGINELEYVDGSIFANLYPKDQIVRIDAATGKVSGVLDLKALRSKLPSQKKPAEELNGIAHDRRTGHLWVTGKYWPQMFVIELGD